MLLLVRILSGCEDESISRTMTFFELQAYIFGVFGCLNAFNLYLKERDPRKNHKPKWAIYVEVKSHLRISRDHILSPDSTGIFLWKPIGKLTWPMKIVQYS
jgi:hypothetical protein